MRTLRVVLALTVLAASAGMALAQDKFTDPGLVPGAPFPVDSKLTTLGSLTFYPDRATFQAANPGLPLEDFSGTSVPGGGIAACTPPLDSTTNDACFAAGSVIPGFSLGVFVDGGGGDYVVLNNALGMPCVGVGPNSFVDDTDFDFSPAVMAAAMDLFTPLGGGEPYVFEVFGPGGSLGSVPVTGGGTGPSFFGVDTVDSGGITRIEIREGVDSTGDILCDLEFGGTPVPVMLQSVEVE